MGRIAARRLGKWAEHVSVQVKGFVSGLPGNAGGRLFCSTERPAAP